VQTHIGKGRTTRIGDSAVPTSGNVWARSGHDLVVKDRRARFEELYREYVGVVAAYALRRASKETAEDVVAETFLVAWRRLDRVPDQPLPWLYAVARRTLANQRRSAARRESLVHRLELEFRAMPPNPVDGHLLDALGSLRPDDREVLMLVAWEGLTATEAAQGLDCSPVACRIRLHRARKRLARALEVQVRSSGELTTTEAK
jgi:RNA polymerase sigma-70 factor (ECF subfamily)